jgi:glutathione synthase/RimK-type ligase-like ATP-grasp enzyme
MSTSAGAHSDLETARLLAENGRYPEAQALLLALLGREPRNAAGIVELGRVVLASGTRDDAETILRHAVRSAPDSADAHATLGFALAARQAFDDAKRAYERAIVLDPALAIAHHGLARVLEATGERARADDARERGMRARPVTFLRGTAPSAAARVVLLGTARTGNTPLADAVDPNAFAVAAVVAEYADAAMLPAHDVIVNVIGEADRCADVLAHAEALVARAATPVINPPARVRTTGRLTVAQRLRAIDGLIVPATARTTYEALRDRPLHEPFLVRALGHHFGELFFRISDEASRAEALAALAGHDLIEAAFLDARGRDGLVRKYRVLFIDGGLYPVHAAVGDAWKLHFVTGHHDSQAASEDATFLADPAAVVGPRAYAALHAVRDELRLDYAGVDFGLDAIGNVLLFEANATMSAPWPATGYRREPIARIRTAVQEMIAHRARVNAP